MTIFKAFLQILNRNKLILIIYSVILVFFSIFNTQNSAQSPNFQSEKPTIYLDNRDEAQGITQSLADYLAEHAEIVELDNADEALDDAIFYRQVDYAVEIPAGFREDFLAGQNPRIAIRRADTYESSLAENLLKRFLQTAESYRLLSLNEEDLIARIEQTLANELEISVAGERHSPELERAASYYNFLNYTMLAGGIFMVCMVLLSFREHKVARRIAVGTISPARVNRILLGANLLFMLSLWAVYVATSFVLAGEAMASRAGMILILNSLIFTVSTTALALLLANLIKSRGALNGIVNVIALGSSFLCGAFVPLAWLPESVRTFAHVLPSFWYIDANEQITQITDFSWPNLQPILINMLVVLSFGVVFIVLANILKRVQNREN